SSKRLARRLPSVKFVDGEPVPAEQALAADDQVGAEGFDSVQEGIGRARQVLVADGLALLIQDAQVHSPCVQVHATVESVLLLIEAHDRGLQMGKGKRKTANFSLP